MPKLNGNWNEWSEKIREESTYRKYSIKMKRGWKCNLQDNKNVKIFKIHATIVNNERIERDRKISIYIYIPIRIIIYRKAGGR